ncbi:hypothetical protein BO82DRAFT_374721 [Aspergillus uvarum CBS 121591]|uniref:Aminoglycoside phosphotransferase domain-containing protein n=1 Tax=Aspergillus uvarum CBS 121591 TaxID=1448315 RepID=A0A319DQK8_9EURO|nr:hypothetical protein BO82DRAFT_374721 [Aspergillus uvarum CBS 121591]PYH81522.1 hypothetical protein BO82DRAFT_374721 [Aspergillus uvarum CBS 121591]
MLITRKLLRREIRYESVKEEETNILHQLGYYDKQFEFFSHLHNHQGWIQNTVAHHLSLDSPDLGHVSDIEDWLHESFDVCVPVTIRPKGIRVILRLPLPYRVGEDFMPGNGDEKVRYVPIPALYGFALSTGETFTCDNLPLLYRWFHSFPRLACAWLGFPVPSRYVPHQPARNEHAVTSSYLLLEYIEPTTRGSILSNTWADAQNDSKRRANIFHGLARILLRSSQTPDPKIGSFIIDPKGYFTLANWPLSMEIQQLENEHIPTGTPRDYTYSTVDSYVTDIFDCHDCRFRHQPNAINDLGDCLFQLASLAGMRTVSKSIFQKGLRRGPFVFSLTDLHQRNIFVDADWDATCLVDLEWTCALPVEMVRPPYWLTNMGVDELVASESDPVCTEFMDALVAEEKAIAVTASHSNKSPPLLSEIMQKAWATGTFWYTLALFSPSGLFMIFKQHVRPLFAKIRDIGRIAAEKLFDRKQYDR